jgi:hypothetical protein
LNLTSQPWFPGFVTGMLALIAVVFGAVMQNRRERKKAKEDIKTPAPPTTQQVWERLDRVEKVLGSSIVLLTEVADQWQGEHPPILSKRHLEIVSAAGYLPAEWETQLHQAE